MHLNVKELQSTFSQNIFYILNTYFLNLTKLQFACNLKWFQDVKNSAS